MFLRMLKKDLMSKKGLNMLSLDFAFRVRQNYYHQNISSLNMNIYYYY